MNTDKIGVALWSLGPTPDEAALRRSLETTAEIGLKGVQPWCVGDNCVLDPDRCPKEKRAEMKKIIESYGLGISGFCAQLSGPTRFGGLDEEDGIRERIEKTKSSLELAADMGAPVVTTHPGRIPEDTNDPIYQILLRAITEIAKHGEQVGGIFCIETGQESAEVLKAFMERVNSPGLRANYDPANMLRHGAVEGVKTLAPWIVHTHAKDNDPVTHKATLGQGAVPWDPYLQALKEINYEGWFAIEDETGKDVVNSLKEGYAFLKAKLASL
jgi:sugar phosphate isomerase/epimerase